MFVKVAELVSKSDGYTSLNGLTAKERKERLSIRETVLNTEKIIRVSSTNKFSPEELKESFPQLSEEASVSSILIEEGQHTKEIFAIGNIDLFTEKFNLSSRQILKG
jgi:hypothetical protein